MSEFLKSVKADLTDRRLLPVVATVGVCLLAAVAYAVMGGSSSKPSTAVSASVTSVTHTGGIVVSATTSEKAVAETTNGVSEQRSGTARNPFAPIPGTTPPATSASTGSSSSGSGSSTSSSGSGSSTPTEETKAPEESTKPPAKPKTRTVYHVAIEFGLFPAGATPETVVLTPYENLRLLTALPTAKQPLIVFRGVTSGGKAATFSIVGEAILHGVGTCLPSASQCQALDLKPGQSEMLEYLPPGGEPINYELRVVNIAASKAAAKASAAKAWGESRAGAEVLRRAGLEALPFLRYSSQRGVLVFPRRGAFSARAHKAHASHRRSR